MGGPTNGGRSRAMRALRDSDELHRAVLANVSDAVFVTDDKGDFTFVCPNVDVIFGFVPDEVHEMANIEKLLGENLFDPNRLAAEGEISNVEREITAKSGDRRTVLIQIKNPPAGKYEVPTKPAVIDQKGCQYNPHMVALMEGQELEIRNSDDTNHNIHFLPKKNEESTDRSPRKTWSTG